METSWIIAADALIVTAWQRPLWIPQCSQHLYQHIECIVTLTSLLCLPLACFSRETGDFTLLISTVADYFIGKEKYKMNYDLKPKNKSNNNCFFPINFLQATFSLLIPTRKSNGWMDALRSSSWIFSFTEELNKHSEISGIGHWTTKCGFCLQTQYEYLVCVFWHNLLLEAINVSRRKNKTSFLI